MNPFISNGQDEVRRSLRIIEAQLAKGLSIYELAAILQQELPSCPHLAQLFPQT